MLIGTGFNAEYSNALWTNAHVVQGLEEALALDILSDRNPEAVAFRSGSMFGSQDEYVIPDPGLIHPAYDSTEAIGDTPMSEYSSSMTICPEKKRSCHSFLVNMWMASV